MAVLCTASFTNSLRVQNKFVRGVYHDSDATNSELGWTPPSHHSFPDCPAARGAASGFCGSPAQVRKGAAGVVRRFGFVGCGNAEHLPGGCDWRGSRKIGGAYP